MKIRRSKRAEKSINRYLMAEWKLDNDYLFEMPDFIGKLVFMVPEDLFLFCQYVGCVMNSKKLQQRIDGEFVRSVKSSIDEDAYSYGLHRADYYNAEYDLSDIRLSTETEIARKIIQSGVSALIAIVETCGQGIARRLLLKFPKPWSEGVKKIRNQDDREIITLLVKEVFNDVVNPK